MKIAVKNFVLAIIIFLILAAAFSFVAKPFEKKTEIPLSQLVSAINDGKIKKISVSGNSLSIIYNDGSNVLSTKEEGAPLSQTFFDYGINQGQLKNVEIETKIDMSVWTWLGPILVYVLPLVLFIFVFFMIFKQARGGAAETFNFTKARARLFGAEGHSKEKITFDDVAGLKEAKEELKEVVDFLKNPQKYLKMGAKIPRGVLLLGGAGVGKTMLARAVAGEANVPFFSISGSEFVEMFVGVGSARVRDLFGTAKKASPSIIFIDELDAIGRHRGAGIGGGHDEREQTLNQILVEMDGFERETNVIVIAATNRGDILDPALLRPGRFDRKVILDPPDVKDREEILKIHCRQKPLAQDINLREIAERTPGFSGADLANVANEAAIFAARMNKEKIHQIEFLESIEKVLLGPERRSYVLSIKEKEIAAFHEAGHALAASFLPHSEPVRKISIIARGMAAGYTLKISSEEKRMRNKKEFLTEIATLLAGRCAEEVKFGEITTGSANDLEKASELARRIVKEYGMSSLGPISYGEKEELVFLGKEISEQRNYSEKTALLIDQEVKKIILEAEKDAMAIIKKKKNFLDKLAKTLITKETIEREEFEKMLRDEQLGEKDAGKRKISFNVAMKEVK
jgi:cell division protease FtsH